MLRLLLCVLLLAFVLPALAAGQETRIANPANLDRAEAMLGEIRLASDRFWRSYDDFQSSIGDLFKKQFTCQKEPFEKAKQELLGEFESEISSARRNADSVLGSPQSRWDIYLKELVELRDFIKSLQYRECQKPTRKNASGQASARGAFRQIFDVERLTACEIDECPPGTVIRGYDWRSDPSLGTLFENLSIYQKICDKEGFNRQKASISKLLVGYVRYNVLEESTARKAKDALEKIEFVDCPKTHTATAEPQPGSGGTAPNPNATPSPNTTPTPAVTPGSEDQTPDEDPLPGLDDEKLPGLDDPPPDEQQETEDASYEPGASYTIAVQLPDVCLGKIYTVTEGTVVQTGDVPVTWTDIPVMTDSDETQVDAPSETMTSENVASGDAPAEAVPAVSVPEENTQETPQVEVPVASSPENDAQEEETDLGLVKAQQTVVELALTRETDGEPVTEAVVKILDDEPPLPGSPGVETAFEADAFFEDDVDGGISGDDGNVEISFAAEAAARPADESGATSGQDGGQTLKVSIDDTPHEQLVVALNGETPKNEAIPAAMNDPVLSRYVTNVFSIGTQPVLVVSAPAAEMDDVKTYIENANTVAWFEPDPCRNKEDEIDDPYFHESGLWGQGFDDQWAIKRAGFSGELIADALNGTDTNPVVVAVIDTGLDWFHPDLDQGSIWRNDGEIPGNGVDDDGNGYIDDTIGWNFISGNGRPWDHDGHGTFVAGVIAAATNNGVGIAGASPDARIMPLKALDAFGRGHASTIAEAIAYAADNGARVINLSLGGRGLTRVETLAVEHAAASGALVVVAAGNTGADVSEYGPAGLDGVITVSATDRRDRQAGFSNWGEEVDISAPGVDVLSLRARKTDLLSYIPGVEYEPGAGIVGEARAYFRASGTSFAAPIVTSAAALIMSMRPDVEADAARRMLLNAAKDIETPGIDNFTGYGLLDVQAALAADPGFSIESRIERVEPVEVQGKPALRLIGTADASEFGSASLALGAGKDPKNWRRIKKRIEAPVRGDVLMDLPAGAFRGSKSWTIRLITTHKNGEEREARFSVTLG